MVKSCEIMLFPILNRCIPLLLSLLRTAAIWHGRFWQRWQRYCSRRRGVLGPGGSWNHGSRQRNGRWGRESHHFFLFFWCKASCWAVIWFRPIKDGTMKWTNHVFILNHFSFYSLAILRTFGGRSEIGPFTTWRFQPRRIVSNLRDWCTDSLCLDTFWYTLEQLLASHC